MTHTQGGLVELIHMKDTHWKQLGEVRSPAPPPSPSRMTRDA